MNLHNEHAHRNSFWDWTPLNECFGRTNIRVTDIDGFVERKGRFLVIETKKPSEEIPQGQALTFEALVKTGIFTVVVVWGPRDIPKEIQVLTRDERKNKHYLKADMEILKRIITEWFLYADTQQSSINLPKAGSHVNFFAWDNSTLIVQALGHEGPCQACEVDMRKGSYFRVTDGRIMHLECVRDWEARSRATQDNYAADLRAPLRRA